MILKIEKNTYQLALELFKRKELASPRSGEEFYANGTAHPLFHLIGHKLGITDEFLQTSTKKEFTNLLKSKLRNKHFNRRFQESVEQIEAVVEETGYDKIFEDDETSYITELMFGSISDTYNLIKDLYDEWELDFHNDDIGSCKRTEYIIGNQLKSLSFDTGLRSSKDSSATRTIEHWVPRIWTARHYLKQKLNKSLSLEYMTVTFLGRFGTTAKVTPNENATLMHYQKEESWDDCFGEGHWEENMGDKFLYAYIANGITELYDSNDMYKTVNLLDRFSDDEIEKLKEFSNGKFPNASTQQKTSSSSGGSVIAELKPKVKRFIEQECIHGSSCNITTRELHTAFQNYAEEEVHIITFGRIISELGYERTVLDEGRGWTDLSLAAGF